MNRREKGNFEANKVLREWKLHSRSDTHTKKIKTKKQTIKISDLFVGKLKNIGTILVLSFLLSYNR